jgi:hypothetical protein
MRAAALLLCLAPQTAGSPYPPSATITGVSFNWATHDRRAPGSDNWPITWADDDHQYASWGDGGGFGGTNSDGRVSLGFARVEGPSPGYTGFNVWGGKNPENPAQFDGKCYGIVSIGGVFYMWRGPGSDTTSYNEARIYRSTDHAASWTAASWAYFKADGIVMPTICNFGRDYAGARDGYVYHYFIKLQGNPTSLNVHKPGVLYLVRAPKDQLMTQSSYQWFAGMSGGQPTWSANIASKQPVFQDPNGVGWCLSVSYNAGLRRYLLATEHDATFGGNLGLFDAPEPWGPWTTVLYTSSWGSGNIETSTFFWNFSNKWLSADGKSFTLVFTGVGSNDSWNTVRGSFTTAASPTNQAPSVSAGPDQTVTLPSSASLSGSASDDGLPNPPGSLTTTWSKVSGPGTVTFGNASALATTASFSTAGAYVLRLSASDGVLSSSDDLTVTVLAPPSGGLISNLIAASGKAYAVDTLAVGKLQYVDRTFTFTTVPPSYDGLDYVRTANDDKGSAGSAFLSFDVSQDATVWVAHDDRFAAKPSWMAGFVDTGDDLVSGGGTFSLWAKDYPAGSVVLGGNTDDGVAQNSMYTVVVAPRGPSPTDTDGDGMADALEVGAGFDPRNGDQDANGTPDGLDDWDGDGTNNQTELANGTPPGSPPGAAAASGSDGGGGCGATGMEALLLLGLAAALRRRAGAALLLAGAGIAWAAPAPQATPPYPPSPVIQSITWDWSTDTTAAPGSDQWRVTWADDDRLYLVWGDGGGFGGTNSNGRASMGVGRIDGTPPSWTGRNVWGGVNPLSSQATIAGKPSGVLCVNGVIVIWAVKQDTWDWTRIVKSSDHGLTWTVGNFILEKPLASFAAIQFGRNYAGARDGYIYGTFDHDDGRSLCLARVPIAGIESRSSYQVLSGFDAGGNPTWSANLAARRPVFTAGDLNWGYEAVYHPVLRRYLLSVTHGGGTADEGPGLGIFDAPEPWGPWTTAYYTDQWKDGFNKFCFEFPQKWMSADGRTLWMKHSGWPEYDSYNHVKCTFTLRSGNQSPSVSITNPAAGASFTAPATIAIQASASDPDGTVARVEFFADGTLLGSDTSSPFSFSWTDVPAGSYSLTARATDNGGGSATSSPVAITVSGAANQPPTAPDRSVTVPQDTPTSIALGYADPDGPGPYTFTVLQPPSQGSLSGTGGSRTYAPNPGFTGTDTFRWKVNDGLADSNEAAVTITVTPAGAFQIANTSPSRYLWDTLDAGKAQYIDRAYTFTAVGVPYAGLPYLKTANDDKGSTGSTFITFDVNQAVTVYVAHDDRFAAKPAWMDLGFTDVGDDLASGAGTFSLWAKDFAAGTVTLGGNTPDGVAQNSMYSVVVRPAAAGPGPDGDADGMPDAFEKTHGFDPANADQDANGRPDGDDDWDADGIPNRMDSTPGGLPVPVPSGSGDGGGGCGAAGLEAPLVLLVRRRR